MAAPIADFIGRKPSVTLWCCIFAVGNIVMISSEHHWYQIMMGRWVAGLGVGALSLLVPMYMGKLERLLRFHGSVSNERQQPKPPLDTFVEP